MPEGDTIFRTAARLREALEGLVVADARGRDPNLPVDRFVGRRVTAVEARGKHLLVHLDDRSVVHSHMGMTGAWHVYRPAERWRKPLHQAALVLESATAVCVCFSPKTLEFLSDTALRRHPVLKQLGPDLLDAQVDEAEILRRFRLHGPTPIGEAVMNQSVVCGIGNVYKSEALFLARSDPFQSVVHMSDDEILAVVRQARRLMLQNRGGYPRRTRFGRDGSRIWVYGRSRQPCFVCGEQIAMRRQGDLGRSTYWCPACQSPAT